MLHCWRYSETPKKKPHYFQIISFSSCFHKTFRGRKLDVNNAFTCLHSVKKYPTVLMLITFVFKARKIITLWGT